MMLKFVMADIFVLFVVLRHNGAKSGCKDLSSGVKGERIFALVLLLVLVTYKLIQMDNQKVVELCEPQTLAKIIRTKSGKVLIIDSRSFLEYNSSHIMNAVNVCCSKIMKRRLEHDKVSVRDFLVHSCHISIESDWDIIVYDQQSQCVLAVQTDSFLYVLLHKLLPVFANVSLLRGGLQAFLSTYPSLCENKAKCGGVAPMLQSVSQPCMPISNQGPTRILPFLYLGSQIDACNKELMQSHNIQYTLNVSTTCPQPDFIPDGNFLRIPVNDNYCERLLPFFQLAFQFLDKVRQSNGCVLVHCLAGISRSPTIAIAYIMQHLKMCSDDAYRYVKSKRATISPNFNFLGQLFEYEKQLKKDGVLDSGGSAPCGLSARMMTTSASLMTSSDVVMSKSLPFENASSFGECSMASPIFMMTSPVGKGIMTSSISCSTSMSMEVEQEEVVTSSVVVATTPVVANKRQCCTDMRKGLMLDLNKAAAFGRSRSVDHNLSLSASLTPSLGDQSPTTALSKLSFGVSNQPATVYKTEVVVVGESRTADGGICEKEREFSSSWDSAVKSDGPEAQAKRAEFESMVHDGTEQNVTRQPGQCRVKKLFSFFSNLQKKSPIQESPPRDKPNFLNTMLSGGRNRIFSKQGGSPAYRLAMKRSASDHCGLRLPSDCGAKPPPPPGLVITCTSRQIPPVCEEDESKSVSGFSQNSSGYGSQLEGNQFAGGSSSSQLSGCFSSSQLSTGGASSSQLSHCSSSGFGSDLSSCPSFSLLSRCSSSMSTGSQLSQCHSGVLSSESGVDMDHLHCAPASSGVELRLGAFEGDPSHRAGIVGTPLSPIGDLEIRRSFQARLRDDGSQKCDSGYDSLNRESDLSLLLCSPVSPSEKHFMETSGSSNNTDKMGDSVTSNSLFPVMVESRDSGFSATSPYFVSKTKWDCTAFSQQQTVENESALASTPLTSISTNQNQQQPPTRRCKTSITIQVGSQSQNLKGHQLPDFKQPDFHIKGKEEDCLYRARSCPLIVGWVIEQQHAAAGYTMSGFLSPGQRLRTTTARRWQRSSVDYSCESCPNMCVDNRDRRHSLSPPKGKFGLSPIPVS